MSSSIASLFVRDFFFFSSKIFLSNRGFLSISFTRFRTDCNFSGGASTTIELLFLEKLIPISEVTIEECIDYSIKLSKKVGSLLKIPVFLYEYSCNQSYRKNLADIRSGEYEGMETKMQNKKWYPDFG